MELIREWVGLGLSITGLFFFVAGTVGLLRFPDFYTRLHVLTKADNLGLGLVALGLALSEGSLSGAIKLILVWLLVLLSSATACYLMSRAALHNGVEPWRNR